MASKFWGGVERNGPAIVILCALALGFTLDDATGIGEVADPLEFLVMAGAGKALIGGK